MRHHITVKGLPLCKNMELDTTGVYCNHLTEVRAKTALLRLIEQNPMHPVGDYTIKPGMCNVISDWEVSP